MSNETGVQWHTHTCGDGSGPPCTCSGGCRAHSQSLLLVEANKSNTPVLITVNLSYRIITDKEIGYQSLKLDVNSLLHYLKLSVIFNVPYYSHSP